MTKEKLMTRIAKKSLMLASIGIATVLMSGVLASSASAAQTDGETLSSARGEIPITTAYNDSTKAIPGVEYANGSIYVTMTKNQTKTLGDAVGLAEFAVGDLSGAASQLCSSVPIPFGPTVCSYLVTKTLGSWIPQIRDAASEYQCLQISTKAYLPFPAFWNVAKVQC
jgi:hypothetical protein